MISCSEMKVGEVYTCTECGIELEVKKSCNCNEEHCEPMHDHGTCCEFECCGKPMELKA